MKFWEKGELKRAYLHTDRERWSAWIEPTPEGGAQLEYKLQSWTNRLLAESLLEGLDERYGGGVIEALTHGLFSWAEIVEIDEDKLGEESNKRLRAKFGEKK